MVAENFTKPVIPPKCVIEMHRRPASDHENMADATFGKSLNNVVGQANHFTELLV
jgi:hypothetical protein